MGASADDVLARIYARSDADDTFVHRLIGWLVVEDRDLVALVLDKIDEADDAKRGGAQS